MRSNKFILLLIILLALACRKEDVPGDTVSQGFGGIELRLDSSGAIRLETKADADELLDGSRFNNVLVILTDNSGTIVGSVYKSYPYVPGVDDIQDSEAASSVTEDVIHFQHLLPGNYHVYAYANIDASAWQDSEAISTQEKVAPAGSSFSAFADRELASLTDTNVPGNPVSSMLLTGQMDIPVGLSLVEKTLDLLRPVVRLKVTVRNNTEFPVKVEDLHFSNFSPDKAYLLGRSGSSGIPEVPPGVTYRPLPAFDTSAPEASVAANSEDVVYETLLYENAAPDRYKVFSTITMDRSSQSLSDLTLSLGARPFGVITYETLASDMLDGEYVDVLVINPRSNTRTGRLYYGIGDTGLAWESCGYNAYAKFVARAQAIYNEVEDHTYVDYKYTGPQNTKSGIAGWTGNAADDPLTSDSGNENDGITFHYTGAKSTYFRRLSKSGGLFTLEGLSINPPSETSISGVSIVPGKNVSGKFANDIPSSYLICFQNGSGQQLKSFCQYNESTVNKTKNSKLIWENAASDTQDHQFMLFGQYNCGGIMRRILKQNNKEVPLTYMARNEEINVVINVFYADQEGELQFVVDNSHWTDDAATISEHTFN